MMKTSYNNSVSVPSAPPMATVVAVNSIGTYEAQGYKYNENINTGVGVVQVHSVQTEDASDLVDQVRLNKLAEFISEHEISNEYAIKLRQLEGYDIVLICDDSGSMNTAVTTPNTKDFMKLPTRWKEMKAIVSVIMEVSIILDNDGIDVYFLNRPPEYNVANYEKIEKIFKKKPAGYTPIVNVFKRVLQEKTKLLAEKKLLIILATDGEPTNDVGKLEDNNGVKEKQKLYDLLKFQRNPQNKIHTTVLACTDDDSTMEYLDEWDKTLHNFDLVDDYWSEKERIKEAQESQGKSHSFSHGDYIVKILLGSIDRTLGSMDGSSADATPIKQVSLTYVQPVPMRQTYQSNSSRQLYVQPETKKSASVCVIS